MTDAEKIKHLEEQIDLQHEKVAGLIKQLTRYNVERARAVEDRAILDFMDDVQEASEFVGTFREKMRPYVQRYSAQQYLDEVKRTKGGLN